MFNNLNGESKTTEGKNESNQKKIIQFFKSANQDRGKEKSDNKAQPSLSLGDSRHQHPPKNTPTIARGLVMRNSPRKPKKPSKNKTEISTQPIFKYLAGIQGESESQLPTKKKKLS